MGGLNMTLIPLHGKLGRGLNAIVDDDVAGKLRHYPWKRRNGYVARRHRCGNRRRKEVYLHREVLRLHDVDIPPGHQIDHINHDTSDNRMENLRVVTVSQNQHNQKIRRRGTSRYKGVYWREDRGKWVAHITYRKKVLHLGLFDNQRDAARAYDEGATKLFGEFAHTNQELLDTTEFIEAAAEAC